MAEREELLSGHAKRETDASNYGTSQALDAQREVLREQDGELDALSGGTGVVKKAAAMILGEVVQQTDMLTGVEADAERGLAGVARGRDRLDALGGDVYNVKTFCMLLWPLVLLIVLVVEGVLHFLFR